MNQNLANAFGGTMSRNFSPENRLPTGLKECRAGSADHPSTARRLSDARLPGR
jgi:hypothetical protein